MNDKSKTKEPKFTRGPCTAFEVNHKYANGRVDYGVEDKDANVLCWADSGPRATRKANVNLWAVAPEMYDFIHFFETFAGQAYLRILPDEAGKKIYEEAVRLCKKARAGQ